MPTRVPPASTTGRLLTPHRTRRSTTSLNGVSGATGTTPVVITSPTLTSTSSTVIPCSWPASSIAPHTTRAERPHWGGLLTVRLAARRRQPASRRGGRGPTAWPSRPWPLAIGTDVAQHG